MESAEVSILAEVASLRARVAELTPWAVAGLVQEDPAPGSPAAALLDDLTSTTPAPQALSELVPMMISDLSEDLWCAGWLHGCEFDLWARVVQYRRTGRASRWGMGFDDELGVRVDRLAQASEVTGTWAVWTDAGERAVPLDVWLAEYWPTAPEHCRNLAQAPPTCDEPGPMVARESGWPYLSFCNSAHGHAGEHDFTTPQD